tara:strand:- start:377 stop:481 length:105 start_codon:yes stop_codon:yes gene_type:complete
MMREEAPLKPYVMIPFKKLIKRFSELETNGGDPK